MEKVFTSRKVARDVLFPWEVNASSTNAESQAAIRIQSVVRKRLAMRRWMIRRHIYHVQNKAVVQHEAALAIYRQWQCYCCRKQLRTAWENRWEQQRNTLQHTAAKTIQHFYRSHTRATAAKRIQNAWRSYVMTRQVTSTQDRERNDTMDWETLHVAALIIQTNVRRWQACTQRLYLKQLLCIESAQCAVARLGRGYLCRKSIAVMQRKCAAIKKIVNRFRCSVQKQLLAKAKEAKLDAALCYAAARTIQTAWRGVMARQEALRRQQLKWRNYKAAAVIQHFFRHVHSQAGGGQSELHNDLAARISQFQHFFRNYLRVKRLKERIIIRDLASRFIASVFAGYRGRRQMLRLRVEAKITRIATMVQKKWRQNMILKTRVALQEQNYAATAIQSAYRRYHAHDHFVKMKLNNRQNSHMSKWAQLHAFRFTALSQPRRNKMLESHCAEREERELGYLKQKLFRLSVKGCMQCEILNRERIMEEEILEIENLHTDEGTKRAQIPEKEVQNRSHTVLTTAHSHHHHIAATRISAAYRGYAQRRNNEAHSCTGENYDDNHNVRMQEWGLLFNAEILQRRLLWIHQYRDIEALAVAEERERAVTPGYPDDQCSRNGINPLPFHASNVVDLRNQGLVEATLRPLLADLRYDTKCVALLLDNNLLRDEACIDLARLLQQNDTLQLISLNHNNITGMGASQLTNVSRHLGRPITFEFDGTLVSTKRVEVLRPAAIQNGCPPTMAFSAAAASLEYATHVN